ncbi:TrbC/VirB2 family protein [Telmatospirillum sp.]|uniref:TrbC/VirB2 family protein n=1 Tax=Telmatospirillum sp. TaxID=2079197 RepID=UPI00283D41B6|nr:TrbC/VirB2 family protein [Telmatospirillum sp.]MDR3438174.1 TrbC/VirB2 family protein [Telmatospirillum sp.]
MDTTVIVREKEHGMQGFIKGVVFGIVLVGGLVAAIDPALAADSSGSGIFSSVQSKATDIFTNVRNILMIVGAIAVLGLATMAFFGKFKWSWAVSLLGGLVLIAFVGQVVQYFISSASIPTN